MTDAAHAVADRNHFAHSVVDPGTGRRYETSESDHEVILVEPTGERLVIGEPGRGVGQFQHPRGLALAAGPTPEATRVYICDSWNHRIQVLDGDGRPLWAFGSRGTAHGSFNVPSDIAIVSPMFPDEDCDERSDAEFVAVADRWNCRVQIFDRQGVFIRSIGVGRDDTDGATLADPPGFTRAGWPFFRTGRQPVIWFPIALEWAAPRLVVTGADGRVTRIDLAAALLPDFDDWRRAASAPELSAAHTRFNALAKGGDDLLPPNRLAALETSLGRALLAQDRVQAAHALWAPTRLSALSESETDGVVAERLRLMAKAVAARPEAGATRRRLLDLGADLVRVQRARRWKESDISHGALPDADRPWQEAS